MTYLRKALPYIALVLVGAFTHHILHQQSSLPPVYAQAPDANCKSNFTFTGTATQTSQGNHSSSPSTPCVTFGVTYETSGTLSATVQFETSPDNSTWTAVPNSICSSSVQPPCLVYGANPIGTLASSGLQLIRTYQPFWRLHVTATSGSGTGSARIFGVIITANSGPGNGSGGGGGSSTGNYVQPVAATGCPVQALITTGWSTFNSPLLNDFSAGVRNLLIPQNASVINLRGETRARSVPYTICAFVEASYANPAGDQEGGVAISDSTKFESFEPQYGSGGLTGLRILSYNTSSSFNAIVSTCSASNVGSRMMAYRITNDSVNRVWQYWQGGAWVTCLSESAGTFLTETRAGYGGWNGSGGTVQDFNMNLLYWCDDVKGGTCGG